MPGAEWFPGTSLNYAEHVFAGKDDAEIAILHASELRELGELSWGELRAQVAAVAAGLRDARGRARRPRRRLHAEHPRGDRRLPRQPPRSARSGRAARPTSARPASSTASPRSSPRSSSRSTATATAASTSTAARCSPSCRRRCRASSAPSSSPTSSPSPTSARCATRSAGTSCAATGDGAELAFERVPFDHPLWVLYSSGTTGLPKAIVQGQGGILLEHLKKLHLHVDAHPGDRLFWFTTTGWMMWNFLVSGLLTRAAIVLYDGSPGHPDMGVLWDLAERAGVTMFGTSASYIAACMKDGRRARGGPRPEPPEGGRLDRQPAGAGGLRLGLRAARRRHLAVLDQRRHRPLHRLRRRLSRCCRSTAASCRRGRWAPRSRPGTRRATR